MILNPYVLGVWITHCTTHVPQTTLHLSCANALLFSSLDRCMGPNQPARQRRNGDEVKPRKTTEQFFDFFVHTIAHLRHGCCVCMYRLTHTPHIRIVFGTIRYDDHLNSVFLTFVFRNDCLSPFHYIYVSITHAIRYGLKIHTFPVSQIIAAIINEQTDRYICLPIFPVIRRRTVKQTIREVGQNPPKNTHLCVTLQWVTKFFTHPILIWKLSI